MSKSAALRLVDTAQLVPANIIRLPRRGDCGTPERETLRFSVRREVTTVEIERTTERSGER